MLKITTISKTQKRKLKETKTIQKQFFQSFATIIGLNRSSKR